DPLRQHARRGAGRYAATIRADVDLDVDIERDAGTRRGLRQRRDVVGVIDQNADRRVARQFSEATNLWLCDDFVRDEHVRYAGSDEYRRFVGLLATDADGATRHLQSRDVRTFV